MSVSQLPGMISHITVGARACRHVLCAVNLLGRDETGQMLARIYPNSAMKDVQRTSRGLYVHNINQHKSSAKRGTCHTGSMHCGSALYAVLVSSKTSSSCILKWKQLYYRVGGTFQPYRLLRSYHCRHTKTGREAKLAMRVVAGLARSETPSDQLANLLVIYIKCTPQKKTVEL